MACERIKAAITESMVGEHPVKAILDPYNPTGSTALRQLHHVEDDAAGRPIIAAATSIGWSATAIGRRSSAASPRRTRASAPMSRTRASASRCRICSASTPKQYLPDFIVRVDDGTGTTRSNLVVEIKGYRGEDAKDKANTMRRLLGAGRQQPRQVRPLGLRRVQGVGLRHCREFRRADRTRRRRQRGMSACFTSSLRRRFVLRRHDARADLGDADCRAQAGAFDGYTALRQTGELSSSISISTRIRGCRRPPSGRSRAGDGRRKRR